MVDTQHGRVEGLIERTPLGEDVDVFRGIPFAVPPVGARRFTNPQFYGQFPKGAKVFQQHSKS